jgi:hypothetical protein
MAPHEKELMGRIPKSGIHHGSNIRSFDESNYSNESSETNDNSPPDEQIVDIEYDASEIDDGTDFETKMYKVANQTEDDDYIGEVVEYNPDMDDESVEIVVRCPDQSIGLLEYGFPETESPDNSEFVAMINVARETKLVADDDGNVEQTYAEITLDSIERLKNAEIPLKEHKDTWVVATSNELETDGGYNDEPQSGDDDSDQMGEWFASRLLGLGKAMFWATTAISHVPIIILLKLIDDFTLRDYYNEVESAPNHMKVVHLLLTGIIYYGALTTMTTVV